MNELQIFNTDEIDSLKTIKPDKLGHGFFYIVEYGKYIKIGSSVNPYARYQRFKGEAKYNMSNIGRIAISCSHKNFRKNETSLHKRYADARITGTELFNLPFSDVVENCYKSLFFDFSDVEYDDTGFNEFLHALFVGNNQEIKIRNTTLLTAMIANNPHLLLGEKDRSVIQDDIRIAADYNGQIRSLLYELGFSIAVPFLEECRHIVNKPEYEPLRNRADYLGSEMIKSGLEIPIEMMEETDNLLTEG